MNTLFGFGRSSLFLDLAVPFFKQLFSGALYDIKKKLNKNKIQTCCEFSFKALNNDLKNVFSLF